MRLTTGQRIRSWLRPVVLALVAGLLVGACSSSAATVAPAVLASTPTVAATPGPTPTPAPTPAPMPTKGPATAQITIGGDPAAAPLTTNMSVQCGEPWYDGPQIVLYRQASAGGLALRIVITKTQVSVRYASGAGKTYLERDFAGTSVTTFDAAIGAQFDSSLGTAPNAGATGTLGVLTSIKGSVDCGNQQPGTSTITMTGATAGGQLNGVTLSSVRVECNDSSTYGKSVTINGLATIGTTPTLFIVQGTASGFTVAQEPKDGNVAFYMNKTAGSAVVSSGGVHIAGDATEQSAAAGATAHTLTVSGDATCGSTVVS